MSEQEVPKNKDESAENVAQDEVQEPPAAESREDMAADDEKEANTEEILKNTPSEDGQKVVTKESLEENPVDHPPDDENISEVKEVPEIKETASNEILDMQISEQDTQIQEEAPKSTEITSQESKEPSRESSEDKPTASARPSDVVLLEENISLTNSQVENFEEAEAHPLDELTDQQVIEIVNEVEIENRHLELENILFESFLKENDPSSLEGLDEIMDFLIRKSSLSYAPSKDIQDRPSISMDRQRLRLDSYTSITSIAEGKGPKINLSQKTDMLMRAMEESQANLESFLKKSHIVKRNLKSELEEFSIREVEIREATDIFEFNVVTQGYDKLTQRIPAEKFVRYMEEWLKSAQLQIEKLRLRIATLKVQYKKVSQQLIQRQELGENVHAVDFDQLEIENKHFIEKIEQKNIHLIELKKMNGGANLVLSTHKKFLQRQQDDCNKLKDEITYKTNQIEVTEKECTEAEEELNETYEKYEHCKNLKNQYTVPDVMEYVRLKGRLHELRKNMKIWVRRRKIQDIALNTCMREMKNLTGNTNIDPEWFKDSTSLNSDTSEEEMLL